jgi:hypothetical protein
MARPQHDRGVNKRRGAQLAARLAARAPLRKEIECKNRSVMRASGGPVRCEALECQRCGFCLRHCRCVPVVADRSGVGQEQDQAQQSKLCEVPELSYVDGFRPLVRKKNRKSRKRT